MYYAVHNWHGEKLTSRFVRYETVVSLAREWAKHLCSNVKIYRNDRPFEICGPLGIPVLDKKGGG